MLFKELVQTSNTLLANSRGFPKMWSNFNQTESYYDGYRFNGFTLEVRFFIILNQESTSSMDYLAHCYKYSENSRHKTSVCIEISYKVSKIIIAAGSNIISLLIAISWV